jgi:hypothetical protein
LRFRPFFFCRLVQKVFGLVELRGFVSCRKGRLRVAAGAQHHCGDEKGDSHLGQSTTLADVKKRAALSDGPS